MREDALPGHEEWEVEEETSDRGPHLLLLSRHHHSVHRWSVVDRMALGHV